ncbi:MAG: hypothetical protein WCC58_11495 [Burkholderiales bacterium]
MRTTTRVITGLIFATGALVCLPLAAAEGRGINAAYEELSGTHAGKTPLAPDGARGNQGAKGEAGMPGAARAAAAYDAFEELSGTHPTSAAVKAGMQGPSGRAGESGQAGKVNGNSTHFTISGDVQDGCSTYLRCSNQ